MDLMNLVSSAQVDDYTKEDGNHSSSMNYTAAENRIALLARP